MHALMHVWKNIEWYRHISWRESLIGDGRARGLGRYCGNRNCKLGFHLVMDEIRKEIAVVVV